MRMWRFFAGIRTQEHIDETAHLNNVQHATTKNGGATVMPWFPGQPMLLPSASRKEANQNARSLKHEAMQNHDPAFQ
jgi:coproporphyrinogen III oxidase